MGTTRALTWHEAQCILQDYQEVNEWGRKKWTQSELADKHGVGETTIFRVVNRKGSYRNLTPPKSEEELSQEFELLQASLVKHIQEERDEATPGRTGADLLLDEMLEKGRAQRDDPGLADRLAQALAEKQKESNPLTGEVDNEGPKGYIEPA